MVNVYFLSVDGNSRLSEHFKLSEFQCRDGQDFVAVDPRLVELLENIRKVCGDAVHINSGFRTASWNRTPQQASLWAGCRYLGGSL